MLRPALSDLAHDFNEQLHVPRLIAVVSPTCPDCSHAAALLARGLAHRPEAEISVLVVWVLGIAGDSTEAANHAAEEFGEDPRVGHYWEEHDGWSLASSFRPALLLGPVDPEQIAWDVYLLYEPGVHWRQQPPIPTEWAHNRDAGPPGVPRITPHLLDAWLDTTANIA